MKEMTVKDQPKWQSGGGSYKKLIELEDVTSDKLVKNNHEEKKDGTHSNLGKIKPTVLTAPLDTRLLNKLELRRLKNDI